MKKLRGMIALWFLLNACAPNKYITDSGPFPCSEIEKVIKNFEELSAEVHKDGSEKIVLVRDLEKYNLGFLTQRDYRINLKSDTSQKDGVTGEHILGKDAVKAAYAFEVHMDGPITLGKKTVHPEDFGRVEVFKTVSVCAKEILYDNPMPLLIINEAEEGAVLRKTTFFLATLDGRILTAELTETFKNESKTYKVPIVMRPFILLGKLISSVFMGAPTNQLTPSPFN